MIGKYKYTAYNNLMEFTDINAMYKRFRNLTPRENKAYLKWLKAKEPNKDCHHILGSQTGIRLNDLLCVMLTREEHIWAEAHKIEAFEKYLHIAVSNLIEFTTITVNSP